MQWLLAVAFPAAMVVGCALGANRPMASGRRSDVATPPAIVWNAESGLLSCRGGEAVLPIPRELRDQVRVTANEASLLLADPSAALIVILGEPAGETNAPVQGDFPRVWAGLHRRVTGLDLQVGQVKVQAQVYKQGHLTMRYLFPSAPEPSAGQATTYRPARMFFDDVDNTAWTIDYVETGRCRIAAIDRTEIDDRPRLGPLLRALQFSRENNR